MTVGADSANATLTVTNSIIAGFENPLFRLGSGFEADLGISYSSFDSSKTYSAGTGDLTQGGGNITNIAPQFKLPLLGDYRLKAPSPLIDAADPASPTTIDLGGNPREVDGDGANGARADMGAYEYAYRAPTAVIDAPVSAVAGTPVDLSAAASSDPDEEPLQSAWQFGDGESGQGKNVSHAFAAAGTRTVTLTVTDPAGRSATATAAIEVSPAPAADGGAPPAGDPPAEEDPPQGDDPTPGDAPALSGLRVLPKRVEIGRGAPRLVGRASGSRIEFALTRAAAVTLRFEPRAGGRTRAVTLDAAQGANVVRFQGRVSKRRALEPGAYTVRAAAAGGNEVAARLKVLGGGR